MKNCCCLWTFSVITTWSPLLTGTSIQVAWGSIHDSCPQKMTCGQHGRKTFQKINDQEVNSLRMSEKISQGRLRLETDIPTAEFISQKKLSVKGTWTQTSTAALVSVVKTENQPRFRQMEAQQAVVHICGGQLHSREKPTPTLRNHDTGSHRDGL